MYGFCVIRQAHIQTSCNTMVELNFFNCKFCVQYNRLPILLTSDCFKVHNMVKAKNIWPHRENSVNQTIIPMQNFWSSYFSCSLNPSPLVWIFSTNNGKTLNYCLGHLVSIYHYITSWDTFSCHQGYLGVPQGASHKKNAA